SRSCRLSSVAPYAATLARLTAGCLGIHATTRCSAMPSDMTAAALQLIGGFAKQSLDNDAVTPVAVQLAVAAIDAHLAKAALRWSARLGSFSGKMRLTSL